MIKIASIRNFRHTKNFERIYHVKIKKKEKETKSHGQYKVLPEWQNA